MTEGGFTPKPLWPETDSGTQIHIEVFGATGEFASGKTLLGLSLAPGAFPEGHPFAGKPRTLYLDFEKSGATYAGTRAQRVDVPSVMTSKSSGKTYQPLDVFRWFIESIEALQPGQYDVVMADPITDIESGLVEHVKKNCKDFGLTPAQVVKAGGLLWGAVRDYWKQILLQLSAKCQTFFFTSHLRQVWQGGAPVRGKREPKGKETLMELASLYLWLERLPDDKGNVPSVPSAIVLKQRLADTIMGDDGTLEIINLMPPRLPVATANAIRGYIVKPPNYARLKKDERVVEAGLSADELVQIELATAQANQATEETRLERIARQAELQQADREARAAKAQSPDQTVQRHAEKADAEQAEIDRLKQEAEAGLERTKAVEDKLMAGHNGMGRTTEEQRQQVIELVKRLSMPEATFVALLAKADAKKISDLSQEDCKNLIGFLYRKAEEMSGN